LKPFFLVSSLKTQRDLRRAMATTDDSSRKMETAAESRPEIATTIDTPAVLHGIQSLLENIDGKLEDHEKRLFEIEEQRVSAMKTSGKTLTQ
jgi:hypothetical protein